MKMEHLNITQAAKRLGVSHCYVRGWINDNIYEHTVKGKLRMLVLKDGAPIPVDKWDKERVLPAGEGIEYLTQAEACRRTGWGEGALKSYTEIYGYRTYKLGNKKVYVFKDGRPLKEEQL